MSSPIFAISYRIHAVYVFNNPQYLYSHIDEQLLSLGLTETHSKSGQPLRATDIIDIIDGYQGKGYSISTEEELRK